MAGVSDPNLGVPCPTCGAEPGRRCRTLTTGRTTDTHNGRWNQRFYLGDSAGENEPAPVMVTYGKVFDEETRALILLRDRPPGAGLPWCTECGEPIRQAPDVHHRQRRMPGNGRPANGCAVHGRWEADQCHHRRIHNRVAAAMNRGLILSTALDPDLIWREPLHCAWRGAIILLDAPDEMGRLWRPATPGELTAPDGESAR